MTIADVLDLYYTNYVESEGLRDPVTVKGRLAKVVPYGPATLLH